MLKRVTTCLLFAGAVWLGSAADVRAQQTFNFSVGYFTPRGEDARVDGDVINANRSFLAFDVSEFNTVAIGAEWLVPLGEFIEAGAGIGFTRRTVPSVYLNFVDADGSEIEDYLYRHTLPTGKKYWTLGINKGKVSGLLVEDE